VLRCGRNLVAGFFLRTPCIEPSASSSYVATYSCTDCSAIEKTQSDTVRYPAQAGYPAESRWLLDGCSSSRRPRRAGGAPGLYSLRAIRYLRTVRWGTAEGCLAASTLDTCCLRCLGVGHSADRGIVRSSVPLGHPPPPLLAASSWCHSCGKSADIHAG
jgi:hypothetical protein